MRNPSSLNVPTISVHKTWSTPNPWVLSQWVVPSPPSQSRPVTLSDLATPVEVLLIILVLGMDHQGQSPSLHQGLDPSTPDHQIARSPPQFMAVHLDPLQCTSQTLQTPSVAQRRNQWWLLTPTMAYRNTFIIITIMLTMMLKVSKTRILWLSDFIYYALCLLSSKVLISKKKLL